MEAVAQVLDGAVDVLITGHADPDGDVAGGCTALFCALRGLGKRPVIFNPDPFPPGYRHLPGAEHLVHTLAPGARFDATVILDAAHWHKVEPYLPSRDRRGTVVWVDHHERRAPAGDVEWVDEDAAAMGEMLFPLCARLGATVDRDVGMGMYATLLADTGGFRYESTTVTALSLAAELVGRGVKPWDVAEQVYERQPVERVRLLARVLGSLEVSVSGRLASVTLLEEDLRVSGATAAMSDGMINHARGIDGVEMAAQLEEMGPGTWRVTLRSRGTLEAGAVAADLGERGHRFGAVFIQAGPLAEVLARLAASVDRVALAQTARAGSIQAAP
jgi:phosphoesterase RecJ-like protein